MEAVNVTDEASPPQFKVDETLNKDDWELIRNLSQV